MNRRSRDALRAAAPLAECRDCHEPIRFVHITKTGRPMPVNPLTNQKGNVAARIAGGRLTGFVISRDHRPGPLDPFRFMPHHATCEERQRKTSSTTTHTAADEPLF
jgi:ribosomal protein L32